MFSTVLTDGRDISRLPEAELFIFLVATMTSYGVWKFGVGDPSWWMWAGRRAGHVS